MDHVFNRALMQTVALLEDWLKKKKLCLCDQFHNSLSFFEVKSIPWLFNLPFSKKNFYLKHKLKTTRSAGIKWVYFRRLNWLHYSQQSLFANL